MPVDLPKFANTAAELYGIWPALFNWLGGLVGVVLASIVTATWFVRAYIAERDIAIIKNEKTTVERDKANLKAQFEADKTLLTGRLDAQLLALNVKADADRTAAQNLIDVLKERLQLAAQQNAAAKEEAEHAKGQLLELKEKTLLNPSFKDLEIATIDLDTSFDKILRANTAVSKTLTPVPNISIPIIQVDDGYIKVPTAPLKRP